MLQVLADAGLLIKLALTGFACFSDVSMERVLDVVTLPYRCPASVVCRFVCTHRRSVCIFLRVDLLGHGKALTYGRR